MKISAKELRNKLKDQWTDLRHIWLRNKEYFIPKKDDLKKVLDNCKIDMPVISGYNECENFALFLHAAVKQYNVIHSDIQINWAFGDFICQKDTGPFGVAIHSACICLCEEGFYTIEPMEDNQIYRIDNYKLFFINLM